MTLFHQPPSEPDVMLWHHPALQCSPSRWCLDDCRDRFGVAHRAYLPVALAENTCLPSPWRRLSRLPGSVVTPATTLKAPSPSGVHPVGDRVVRLGCMSERTVGSPFATFATAWAAPRSVWEC